MPATSRFRKRYPGFNGLLNRLRLPTWYVHIGACLLDPSATLRYIASLLRHIPYKHSGMVRYAGQVVLVACPQCREGLHQSPTPYRTHTGHEVRFDPDNPLESDRTPRTP